MTLPNQALPKAVLAIALAGAAATTYLLSYAPLHRWMGIAYWAEDRLGRRAYAPVEWMIDESPLREPLLKWANVVGVEDDFRLASWVWTGRVDKRLRAIPHAWEVPHQKTGWSHSGSATHASHRRQP